MPATGPSRLEGDYFITGNLSAASMTLAANAVNTNNLHPSLIVPVAKQSHQHLVHHSQPNVAAVTETKFFFRCFGATAGIAGLVMGALAAPIGAATVTLNVLKNGVSILTAPPATMDNTYTAGTTSIAPALTTLNLVAGDILTIVIVATAGGGTLPTGFFVTARINEDAF